MYLFIRCFFALVFLASVSCLYGQFDSIAKPDFTRLAGTYFSQTENHLQEDTLLDGHFNYFPKDFNGNLGQPSQEIVFDNHTFDRLGLRFFKSNYRSHMLTENDVLFHKTKKPYTRVFALAGMRQEQILKLIHTKNIRRLNYTVIFNRYKSVGFYKNQLAAIDNFISTISYQSKNKRYTINSWFLFNKLRHQENGGLKSLDNFDSLYTENKELLAVNLQSAKRITRNLNTGLYQFFNLSKSNDTIPVTHQFFHRFQFSSDYYVFNDDNPTAGYFPLILLDSTKTTDSSSLKKIRNTTGYIYRFSKGKNKLEANVFYTNELAKLSQYYLDSAIVNSQFNKKYVDTLFVNHITGAEFFYLTESSTTKFTGEFVMAGSNQNNFSLLFNHSRKISFWDARLNLNLAHEKRNADMFYQKYYGNNQQWTMNFNAVSTTQAGLAFSVMSGKVYYASQCRLLNGYIWFNTPDVPLQTNSMVLLTGNTIGGKIKFRSFRWDNRLTYQYANNTSLISIPPLCLQSLFFYDASLFANNLRLQTGFQLHYYSSFRSNAYMPSTNTYYTSGRREVGNYPFIDFFINAEIKPVRFFVLIDHLNQGLTGSNYQLTPGYPMSDRSFKFGFTWLFWD